MTEDNPTATDPSETTQQSEEGANNSKPETSETKESRDTNPNSSDLRDALFIIAGSLLLIIGIWILAVGLFQDNSYPSYILLECTEELTEAYKNNLGCLEPLDSPPSTTINVPMGLTLFALGVAYLTSQFARTRTR